MPKMNGWAVTRDADALRVIEGVEARGLVVRRTTAEGPGQVGIAYGPASAWPTVAVIVGLCGLMGLGLGLALVGAA